jgi:hypothetical protein
VREVAIIARVVRKFGRQKWDSASKRTIYVPHIELEPIVPSGGTE